MIVLQWMHLSYWTNMADTVVYLHTICFVPVPWVHVCTTCCCNKAGVYLVAYLCLSVLGLHVKRSHSLTRAKFHSDLYISEEFLLITSSAQATELIRNSYPSLTDVTSFITQRWRARYNSPFTQALFVQEDWCLTMEPHWFGVLLQNFSSSLISMMNIV